MAVLGKGNRPRLEGGVVYQEALAGWEERMHWRHLSRMTGLWLGVQVDLEHLDGLGI